MYTWYMFTRYVYYTYTCTHICMWQSVRVELISGENKDDG